MNNCKNCGKAVNTESVYCNKCGTKLKTSLLDEYATMFVDYGNEVKIPINPLTFEHCLQIGANAYHDGEYYEALEYLLYAITFDEIPMEKLSNCYNEIGISYLGLKKHEFAIKYFEMSISANPDNLIPLENLVGVYVELDDVDNAIKEFKTLAFKNPNFNPLLWRNIGVACENSKRYLDAKKFYEKAIEQGVDEANNDLQDVIRKMNIT